MNYAIAVLDIGKTNKKLLIYDEKLNLHDSVYKSFPTYKYDGLDVENVEGVEKWLKEHLSVFSKQYPIKIISITTHGAAGVCIDEHGKPSVPVVAYTQEPDPWLHDEFFDLVGARDELQKTTATAELKPLINLGKLIYFLKKRYPPDFQRTRHILFYPQYFGYLLTGNIGADYTYTGCHTYLWDFKKNQWSIVAERLGIKDLLPDKVRKTWEILGTVQSQITKETGLPEETLVTMGVHDSNSSLIPYLIKKQNDFVLNSTGTWCVTMHPTDMVSFTEDEIGKIVFYNIDVFSNPVKTSILMGGMEFETYTGILKELNDKDHLPSFNKKIYEEVLTESDLFILPSVIQGTGQFPDSAPRVVEKGEVFSLEEIQNKTRVPQFFFDYEKAYAVLNLSIAIQTRIALQRVGCQNGTEIYVEGGFRNNEDYLTLLSAFFPDSPIRLTDIKEATSFGAAILGKVAYEQKTLKEISPFFEISEKSVEGVVFDNTDAYEAAFMNVL